MVTSQQLQPLLLLLVILLVVASSVLVVRFDAVRIASDSFARLRGTSTPVAMRLGTIVQPRPVVNPVLTIPRYVGHE